MNVNFKSSIGQGKSLYFGKSNDGNKILFRAVNNDDNGQFIPSNTPKYFLIKKLSENFAGNNFGQKLSVTSRGDILTIGVPNDYNEGSVYLYTGLDSWGLSDIHTDFESFDQFGNEVKISNNGDVLMVAAYGDNNNAGEVILYTGNQNNITAQENRWVEKQRLTGLTPRSSQIGFPPGELFGISIDMNYDGSTLVVGSVWDENYLGTVNIFTGSSGIGWNFSKIFTGDLSDGFGRNVFINKSGNLVGATYNFGGKMVIYNNINNNWNLIKTISPLQNIDNTDIIETDGKFTDNGEILLFNEYFNNSGNISIYTGINNWNLKQVLPYNNSPARISVNNDGSVIVIGYPNYSYENVPNMGKVDIYEGNALNGWNLLQSLSGDYPSATQASGDNFGFSTAVTDDGDVIFIGAPYDGIQNSGSCFIYKK